MPSTFFYKSVGTPTTFIKPDRVATPPTNVGPASAWDAHSGAVTEVTSVEYFTDISTNEFSVTPTSGAVISSDNPYSDSSLSVDCNTTAPAHGHLVIGPSTNLDYDNNTSFTVEFWMKADPASGTTENIVGYGTTLSDAGINWMIRRNSSGIRFMLKSNGTLYYADATTGINEDQWNHVAAVGTGSGIKLWINGVYRTSTAVSTNLQNTGGSLYIGRYTNQFNGKIADFRYVVGTQVYTGTSNFTPPTAPLSSITNTQVLLRPQTETFNSSRALITLDHQNAYNYGQTGSFLGKGIFYVGRMRSPIDGADASLWTGLMNGGNIYAVENRDAGEDDFGVYHWGLGRITNPDVSIPRPNLNQEFTTGMYINSSGQVEYSVNGQVFHTTSISTAVAAYMLPFIRMYGTTTAEYELERVAILTAESHDEAYNTSLGEGYVSKIIRPTPAGTPTPPFSSSSDAISAGYGGSITTFYSNGVTKNAYIDNDGWILYSSFASDNTLTSTNATAWNGNNVLNADLTGLGYTTNAASWNDGTGASTNTQYNRPPEHYYFYGSGNGYVDISTWNGPSNANQIKVIWQGVAPYDASSRVIVNGGSELSTQPTEEAFSPTGSTPLLRMIENGIGIFAVNSIWFKM